MHKLKNFIIDIFFPPKCAHCGKVGFSICPGCLEEIQLNIVQVCPGCNKISASGKYCPRCRPKNHLLAVTTCGIFRDPVLKDAIHDFKYNGIYSLAPTLSEIIIKKILKEKIKFDVITFVPIAKNRERKRGYNQSELLTKEVAKKFEKPLFDKFLKVKYTKPQVGLSGKARRENLKNSFYINQKYKDVFGKKVLLIDDVCTTGSTLNECARVLKKSGAKTIWAVVLARE